MSSRRPHSKSRRGCVACKARKVKCDEVRPSCGRCVKRKDNCYFKDTFYPCNAALRATTPSSLSDTPITQDRDSPVQFPRSILDSPVTRPSGNEQGWGGTFGFRDMELLHHYSTSTCLTLTNVKSQGNLWKLGIPQLAFSNPFLMHGLLAASACHIAHLRPEAAEHYINIAVYHHTSAITLYRPLLNDVSQGNCAPLVAFSAMLGFLSFAIPQTSLPQQDSSTATIFVQNMFGMFGLLRGVKALLASAWEWIRDTPVAVLLSLPLDEETSSPLEPDAEATLKSLEARIHTEAESENMKAEYLEALKCFRKCYPSGDIENLHQGVPFAWPVIVSESFCKAMMERRPIPMTMLGLWGVMLGKLHNVWWIGNQGQRLVEAVSELLPQGWEEPMEWAKMRVNSTEISPHPSAAAGE